MAVKDTVVGWYVKHYIIPRAQVLDSPGFVVFNISGKTSIFARQVIIPELFFVSLEKNLINEFGDLARKQLYSIGKRFGYRFALMSNLSQKPDLTDKKVPEYIEMVNKFIEGTYASNISSSVDVENEIVRYSAKNFVVCSKLGYGYFLPLGAVSGMISYIFNNTEIEGVKTACQGTGSKQCKIICGPVHELEKEVKQKIFNETDLSGLEIDPAYITMNEVKLTENSTYSFNQFIDSNTFSFNQGVIMSNHQRYFIYEISGLHMLESKLQKHATMKKILINVSREVGKKIASDFEKNLSENFLMDLFTAFGWGDVLVFEKNKKYLVNSKYCPWTKFCKDLDFVVLRGFFEGFLSFLLKKEIELETVEKDTSQGYLNLLFHEK